MTMKTSRWCISSISITITILRLLSPLILSLPHSNSLTIAITGSSQGIGLDAAKRLLTAGHTVIHCCRNQDRATIAVTESGGGTPLVCDLSSFDSIRASAQTLITEAPTLDVLCLNAGVAPSTKADVPQLT
eukprot:CAMPEP_0198266616 /NCGR_PEP_ID=MMETSP1447-20131203/29305_1 /TAXON_ID=420782 /ORGANISM="Chaetoceros dichaeta, Strain CCMP1751" /LENGTH=130 /DNA_ID=CAMNT_0043956813 /DNA_START=42 /DNA_END=430 /DNA_ORIENTATION=+